MVTPGHRLSNSIFEMLSRRSYACTVSKNGGSATCDIIERYKKEQPVIDSERQLSGKVVDEEVRSTLERSQYMTP